MIDLPPFDALALSLYHAPGVHSVLVGSGLSRAAGIPTGWEITVDLVRRLAALDGVTEHDDWPKWYEDKYGKPASYSEILDALASTPAERRAILHGYIDASADGEMRKPTKAHHALAQLVASGAVRVIVTTNFDRLIENALRDIGIEPTVIASDDAIAGATPLVHAKCTVIKVHGDYLDARIKNTDAELETYSDPMNRLLDEVFDNFGLLAVGWSGEWDTALRLAILRAPSRRYPFYWAARGGVAPLAQDLLDQRGGRSFSITDADGFFVKLDQTLKALTEASRPHPQSVEMAVALAKRYCRDDQYAMEWAEFLEAEASRIRAFIDSPAYGLPIVTNEAETALVTNLFGRVQALRRACMICGRWGTADANRAVTRAIQSLSFASDPRGGLVIVSRLREFCASICYIWNLSGLADSQAWDAIHRLQNAEIQGQNGPAPLAKLLPLQGNGMEWKFLTGLEKRHTPISDYLAPHFVKDCKDIALDEKRAETLFDQTELLLAFGYGVHRLAEVKARGNHFWVPLGRFIWKREGFTLDDELKRIDALPDDHAFIKAKVLGETKADVLGLTREIREFHGRVASQFF